MVVLGINIVQARDQFCLELKSVHLVDQEMYSVSLQRQESRIATQMELQTILCSYSPSSTAEVAGMENLRC